VTHRTLFSNVFPFIHEIHKTNLSAPPPNTFVQTNGSSRVTAGEFINEKDGGDRYEDSSSVFAKANDDIVSERFLRCIH
jgi:hypothetical protein